jgi:phosphinothricin acetyltransferase
MDAIAIRPATQADLRAIDDIYNWYVPRSTCTYQEEIEPFETRATWFHSHGPKHPVTVALDASGEIVGWGALSEFRERSAYRHTVENSLYIRLDRHGRGIGSALLADLIARATALGHHTIVAGIDAEQSSSIRLHEKFGFVECARIKAAGFKFGRWLDVIYMQLMLDSGRASSPAR